MLLGTVLLVLLLQWAAGESIPIFPGQPGPKHRDTTEALDAFLRRMDDEDKHSVARMDKCRAARRGTVSDEEVREWNRYLALFYGAPRIGTRKTGQYRNYLLGGNRTLSVDSYHRWKNLDDCYTHCYDACLRPALSYGFDAVMCRLSSNYPVHPITCGVTTSSWPHAITKQENKAPFKKPDEYWLRTRGGKPADTTEIWAKDYTIVKAHNLAHVDNNNGLNTWWRESTMDHMPDFNHNASADIKCLENKMPLGNGNGCDN